MSEVGISVPEMLGLSTQSVMQRTNSDIPLVCSSRAPQQPSEECPGIESNILNEMGGEGARGGEQLGGSAQF